MEKPVETKYSIAVKVLMAEHYLEVSDVRDLIENLACHLEETQPTATNNIYQLRSAGWAIETELDEMGATDDG